VLSAFTREGGRGVTIGVTVTSSSLYGGKGGRQGLRQGIESTSCGAGRPQVFRTGGRKPEKQQKLSREERGGDLTGRSSCQSCPIHYGRSNPFEPRTVKTSSENKSKEAHRTSPREKRNNGRGREREEPL